MKERLGLSTPSDPGVPLELPESGRLIIGSSDQRADLVLTSQGVAEVHCVIAKTKDGGWAVQDMGSEFGTLLDGKRVEVARLRAGQTLLVASVSIAIVDLTEPTDEALEPSPTTPEEEAPAEEEAAADEAPAEEEAAAEEAPAEEEAAEEDAKE